VSLKQKGGVSMSGKIIRTVKVVDGYAYKPAKEIQTKTGTPMASFSVSVSKDTNKADGTWEYGPKEYVNCVAFKENAVKALQILTGQIKGVTVEGKEQVEIWEGEERRKLIVDHLSLHDGQTAHGTAKANGFAPESVVVEASDDADIPF